MSTPHIVLKNPDSDENTPLLYFLGVCVKVLTAFKSSFHVFKLKITVKSLSVK